MISALKGTLYTNTTNPITLFVGGVGYAVHVTNTFLERHKKDEEVFLSIHTHVREDALDLFGFETPQELHFFELLLTVSGVGPKTALTVIDHGVSAIHQAVITANVDFFTTIPRLGKKNAQKIIIELKSKLGGLTDLSFENDYSSETKELVDALTFMGFARKEIIECIKKIPSEDQTLEQKVRHALQLLGK